MLNEHKRKCSRTRESSGLISRDFTNVGYSREPAKKEPEQCETIF